MPTPARLAIASSGRVGARLGEQLAAAASSSFSRLRAASARSGRWVVAMKKRRLPPFAVFSKRRLLRFTLHGTRSIPGYATRPLTQTQTRITTPFGAESTAAEVIAGIDLTGRRAIVTGGSSGIGVETARALAGAGAEVTLAVRDTDAGERTAAAIAASTGNDAVHVGRLDLADQASVAAFVGGLERPAATSWSTTPA